jgi:hypothetical protein
VSFANGRYPDSALSAIPGGRLRKDAALRWNAMCIHLRRNGRAIPMPNGAFSSYRTLSGQVLMRRQWCARGKCQNAAVPGTSNHGKGISVDTNQGSTVDSVPQFGFDKRHSDAPWESWHRTWGGYGPVTVHTLKLGERTLRRGVSPGADVRELKRLLQHKSRKPKGRRYFARGVKVDGNYGIGVRRGVRRFQKDHKMKVDGVVGPKTLRAIRHAPTRR